MTSLPFTSSSKPTCERSYPFATKISVLWLGFQIRTIGESNANSDKAATSKLLRYRLLVLVHDACRNKSPLHHAIRPAWWMQNHFHLFAPCGCWEYPQAHYNNDPQTLVPDQLPYLQRHWNPSKSRWIVITFQERQPTLGVPSQQNVIMASCYHSAWNVLTLYSTVQSRLVTLSVTGMANHVSSEHQV